MQQIEVAEIVAAPCETVFDVVNDVARYPVFIPGCTRADILSQDAAHTLASLHIAKGPVKLSFTTHNALTRPNHMALSLREGPFRTLHGNWWFHDVGDGQCKVAFELTFAFQSAWLARMATPWFSRLSTDMVARFAEEARRRTAPPLPLTS